MSDIDFIFKALADPTRRGLLDELFQRDGQSLGELENRVDMTRFGVMKHLRILEEAGLIVPRRKGREKLHYLNVLPIQSIYDRWVTKYSAKWSEALTTVKHDLENMNSMDKTFEIYIKTSPERLWFAITDTEMRRKYNFGAIVTSDWTPGSRYQALGHGEPIFEGENLLVEPPLRLVQTFSAAWSDEVMEEPPVTVSWQIEPIGDSCRLTVTISGLRESSNPTLYGGWPQILSGLKTLIETGEILTTPGSIRWLTQDKGE